MCAILALQIAVAPVDGRDPAASGWMWTIEGTVQAPCTALTLPALPRAPGAAPPTVEGVSRAPNDEGASRSHRWGDERRLPGTDGAGDTVRLPELDERGEATFTWTTSVAADAGPLSLDALHLAEGVQAVVTLARGVADAAHPAWAPHSVQTLAAGEPLVLDVVAPWRDAVPASAPVPASASAPVPSTPLGPPATLTLTVAAPERVDVRRALADRDVMLDVAATWTLPAGEGQGIVTLPPDVAPRVLLDDQPVPGALGPGQVRVSLDPSGAVHTLAVRWTAPIADAWGPLPWTEAARLSLAAGRATAGFAPGLAQVDGTGELLVDGAHWRLARLGDVPLLTDAERFLTELDRRCSAASYPEPALPQRWRALSLNETLPSLKSLLLSRVAVLDAPGVRWLPRRLMRAQASGAMTPLEAAVTLVRLASQLRLPARVVLFDPDPDGHAVPSALAHPVAAIDLKGVTWLLDPQCSSCGPELAPELSAWRPFGAQGAQGAP